MLIKLLKTIVIIFLFFFQNSLYSKNKDSNYLSSKNLAEYLSAITSYDNGENTKSLEFFDKSKLLIDEHNPYLKRYIFSLITEGKINKAIKVLKSNLNKENSNFFESYLLLTIDSIKNKDFKKSNIYLCRRTFNCFMNAIISMIYLDIVWCHCISFHYKT